jgi:hypothetical protein
VHLPTILVAMIVGKCTNDEAKAVYGKVVKVIFNKQNFPIKKGVVLDIIKVIESCMFLLPDLSKIIRLGG